MTASWTTREVSPGRVRLSVLGELDLVDEQALVGDVEALLASDAATTVEVDLAGVEFIDSSGVRALLRLRMEHPRRFGVVIASDAVMRVLRIAGVADMVAFGSERG